MRKCLLLAVALLLAVFLLSCATKAEVKTDIQSEVDDVFTVFKDQINDERSREYRKTYNYSELKQYLKTVSSDMNAVSREEIKTLKNTKRTSVKTITYQSMVEDVDLYFRVLRSHWGAYYYWGGNDTFNKVKDSIIERFEGTSIISVEELAHVMHEEMSFIKDAHFQLGTGKGAHFLPEEDEYWFYYTEDKVYKDEVGYYCDIEGQRYYYSRCDNPNVSIGRRLFSDGTLAYGLIQFARQGDIHDKDQIIVKCNGVELRTEIIWIRSEPLSPDSLRDPDFKLVKKKKLSYIQLRSFDQRNDAWQKKLEAFSRSGSTVKYSDLLIFDIRSNGGGNNRYFNTWYSNYTGNKIDIKHASGRHYGELNENVSSDGKAYRITESQGTRVYSRTATIVLVDNNCGSSGESALNGMKTLTNTIVIGTNSSGCASFGNVMSYYLPNSGIPFTYGTDLRSFSEKMENIDGKGFLPDIWSDPKTVLSAVEKMLAKYSFRREEELNELFDNI